MKNLIFFATLILSLFAVSPALAAGSGACSSHGGVYCAAGWDYDGSVVCADGWLDSTVLYSAVDECRTVYWCTSTARQGLESQYGVKGLTDSILNLDTTYLQRWQDISDQPIEQGFIDGQLNKLNNEYTTQRAALVSQLQTAQISVNRDCLVLGQHDLCASLGATLGSDNACHCGSGYQWNTSGTACVSIPVAPQSVQDAPQEQNTTQEQSIAQTCAPPSAWSAETQSCVMTVSDPQTPSTSNPANASVDPLQSTGTGISTNAKRASKKLLGYILLQTESHGEAWYVDPSDGQRYYMKDGATAYEMMRSFSLGVSEDTYASIEAGNTALKNRLRGKIVLRANAHGEAYYIHPKDLTVYYLQNGDEAYRIMRLYSLGITNANLEKIIVGQITPKN